MPYAWGARDQLAAFLGRPPSGGPEAELWIGAHPGGPARLLGAAPASDLVRLIEDDPERILGREVQTRFGRLPFLLKILAIDAPLSLQTHPDAEQARPVSRTATDDGLIGRPAGCGREGQEATEPDGEKSPHS